MSSVQSTTDRNYNPFDLINATGQQDKSLTASSIKEQQDRFLNLLVTQLKNQDPLNPMDNAQMTSQLAQMSTVSGIEKLNATLNTLLENLGYTQSMEASALIGSLGGIAELARATFGDDKPAGPARRPTVPTVNPTSGS